MLKSLSHAAARALVLLSLGTGAVGCALLGRQSLHDNRPTDLPLSAFIIGRWKSVSVTDAGGSEIERVYEIEFLDDEIIEIAELTPDGRFLYDGTTARYSFRDSNTVSIVSPRAQEEGTWELERNGERLIITRTFDGMTDRIVLVRE